MPNERRKPITPGRNTAKVKPGRAGETFKYITCGTPAEFWGVQDNGRYACPHCYALKDVTKACLKCEKEFTPGCKAKFMCGNCLQKNTEGRNYDV
jgi:hypothetical protein